MTAIGDRPSAVKRRRALPLIVSQEVVLLIVIAAVWLVLSVVTSTFDTANNVGSVLYAVAPIAVIGVGMTAVMVTGGIDVSVGSQVAVVMVVVAKLFADLHASLPVALVAALLVGAVLGTINGLLVAFGNIHPIVVTFGTLNIFRFLALQIFGDQQVDNVPGTAGWLGGSDLARTLGLPNATWVAIVLVALVWFYMRHAATGRHLYALGGDMFAARLAGVSVRRRLVGVYIFTGVTAGLAGVMLVGSGGLVQQNVGTGLELQVIATVVIGGTSVMGGRGTVFGTLLGAFLVATIGGAVTHLQWPSELTSVFVGAFIVIAVGADLARQRRRVR